MLTPRVQKYVPTHFTLLWLILPAASLALFPYNSADYCLPVSWWTRQWPTWCSYFCCLNFFRFGCFQACLKAIGLKKLVALSKKRWKMKRSRSRGVMICYLTRSRPGRNIAMQWVRLIWDSSETSPRVSHPLLLSALTWRILFTHSCAHTYAHHLQMCHMKIFGGVAFFGANMLPVLRIHPADLVCTLLY